jgi:hypothetical protein
MRQRIYRKSVWGTRYVLAACTERDENEKLSLWVNPVKTNARRKTISDLWTN